MYTGGVSSKASVGLRNAWGKERKRGAWRRDAARCARIIEGGVRARWGHVVVVVVGK
jgi:hypothetical protein